MLKKIPLFQALTPGQLAWLEGRLHQKTYRPGSHILLAEQSGELAYIILSGTLKVYVDQRDGTEVILAILRPGDTIGELSLLDSFGVSANVVVMEEAELLWMDRATFWECLKQMPAVTYRLVEVVCRRLRQANGQIQALATLNIEQRVARQLLTLAEQHGQPTDDGKTLIPFRLTQRDLAGLVGASRERVNQVVALYKQRRYITIDRHYHITIQNQTALLERRG